MTKNDFLLQLRRSLSGKMGSAEINELAAYYEEYIEIQVRKGEEEQRVITDLGEPALLVKSILNAEYNKKPRFNDTTFFSFGTRVKSICMDYGNKISKKVKDGLESIFHGKLP